ncbi:MAG TPA: MBL fold metallo-hydrolase [bacterium]|nr:MBL fold metallo-hydrolase [bacterium]
MPTYSNIEPTAAREFLRVLRWALTRKPSPWPKWIESEPGPTPPERVLGSDLRVTYINHATLLIQGGGLNLITDPHWGLRCSPVSFAGPKRVRNAGLAMNQLPPIDAILLSHNHYDHMDQGTLKTLLLAHPNAPVITGLGVAADFPKAFRPRVIELDWWQSYTLAPGIQATFVPSRHFSARGPFDRNKTRWGGFHLSLPGGAVYFAGDTALGQHFRMIRERLEPIRLAILPIGAYDPRWFMSLYHMVPFDAVQAFQDLGASYALGMHYGTFQLTDEPIDEPLQLLEMAKEKAVLSANRFVVKGFGEGWKVPNS